MSYLRLVCEVNPTQFPYHTPNLKFISGLCSAQVLDYFFSVLPKDDMSKFEALGLLRHATGNTSPVSQNQISDTTTKKGETPPLAVVTPAGSGASAAKKSARVGRNFNVAQGLLEAMAPAPTTHYPLTSLCCMARGGGPPVQPKSMQHAPSTAVATKVPHKPTQIKPVSKQGVLIIPAPPRGEKGRAVHRSRTALPTGPQSLCDLQRMGPDGTLSPRPLCRNVGIGQGGLNSGVAVDDEALRLLFNAHDTDGSGQINREEFKAKYKGFESFGHEMSAKEVDRLFNRYDKNHDGTLSFDEFCMLMLFRFKM